MFDFPVIAGIAKESNIVEFLGFNMEHNFTKVNNYLFELMPALTGVEFKMVCFIARQSWGWGRPEAHISLSLFQKVTGTVNRRHIVETRKKLVTLGIISHRKTGKKSYYTINPPDNWHKSIRYHEDTSGWYPEDTTDNKQYPEDTSKWYPKDTTQYPKDTINGILRTPIKEKRNNNKEKEKESNKEQEFFSLDEMTAYLKKEGKLK